MNESFFEIGGLQKKIEQNQQLRSSMKFTGALIVFVIFCGSLSEPETMKIAWIISVALICALFGFEVSFINKIKRYRLEIYRIEKEALENKKELAAMRGEILPDNEQNRVIAAPSEKISLPIPYYVVILILDVLVKVFMR